MSPSRKPRKPKTPKPAHARQRHAEPPPVEPPPDPVDSLRSAVAREWSWIIERINRIEKRVKRLEDAAQLGEVPYEIIDPASAVRIGRLALDGSRAAALDAAAAAAPADVASAIRDGRIVLAGSRAAAAPPMPDEEDEAAPPTPAADEEITTTGAPIETTRPASFLIGIGRPKLDDWQALGAALARHPHRLALALHVARAATSGGGELTTHEIDALAGLFADIVDAGIGWTGGIVLNKHGGQDNPFARAAWYVLATDAIRGARGVRTARCPVMAEVPCPGDHGFVDALRRAAPGYVRTVIAGSTPVEIDALAMLLAMNAHAIDERYRPWAEPFTEDMHHAELMEGALANLTRRYATSEETCRGVENWASAFNQARTEHDIPPVARVGAVVWLARAGLRRDGSVQ